VQVIEAMLPYWTTYYGNPSSSHQFGREAKSGLENGRRTIAQLLNAKPSEIIFTGCGSESDNLALRGVMWHARQTGRGNHLITSVLEHEAVLATAEQLRDLHGFELTVLGVDEHGRVNLNEVEAAIRPDTVLISIMAANNEIGTVQPFLEIGQLARERGVLFHTDAIQAVSLTAWDLATMPIDLLSLAPHKFYGPKGVGILYVRQGINLIPSQTGGGQENGRRPGTVNVPFAVGAAKALELACAERESYTHHCLTLRNKLIEGLLSRFPAGECRLTGHPTERLPHHASFALRGLTGNDMLMHLDMVGISASSGSACATGNPEPSHVLQAIGLGPEWTMGGLRLTVGKQNSPAEIEIVLEKLPQTLHKLKQFVTIY
jgi:cysteine desulfurase